MHLITFSHTIEITDLKVYSGITDTTTQVTTTTLPDKSTNSISITGSSFYLGGNTPTTENDIGVNEQVMSSANFEFIGEKIQSTSSALHGVIATVGVMDSSANFLYQFGTIDVSTLPTTYTWIYFENPQETYTLSSGERIGIKYTGGDVNNRIGVYWDNNGNYDGGNSDGSEESGGAWNDRAGQDLRFKIFPATISTAIQSTSTTGVLGTGIQNPDLSFTDSNLPDNTDDLTVGSWVKLDMGSATSTQLTGGSDTGVVYFVNSGWQRQFVGQEFNTGHELIGKNINSVTLSLKQASSPNDVYKLVKIDSSGTVTNLQDVDISSITTSYQDYTFNSFTPFTLAVDDKIGIYSDGVSGSSSSIYIDVEKDSSDSNTNSKIYQIHDTLGSYTISGDLKFTISYQAEPTNTKLLGLNDVCWWSRWWRSKSR
jgi:hypothetical protein